MDDLEERQCRYLRLGIAVERKIFCQQQIRQLASQCPTDGLIGDTCQKAGNLLREAHGGLIQIAIENGSVQVRAEQERLGGTAMDVYVLADIQAVAGKFEEPRLAAMPGAFPLDRLQSVSIVETGSDDEERVETDIRVTEIRGSMSWRSASSSAALKCPDSN